MPRFQFRQPVAESNRDFGQVLRALGTGRFIANANRRGLDVFISCHKAIARTMKGFSRLRRVQAGTVGHD